MHYVKERKFNVATVAYKMRTQRKKFPRRKAAKLCVPRGKLMI